MLKTFIFTGVVYVLLHFQQLHINFLSVGISPSIILAGVLTLILGIKPIFAKQYEQPSDPTGELRLHKGMRPLLIQARTCHTRFFPKKHSFSYSYLLLGLPVGCRKTFGSLLSLDTKLDPLKTKAKKCWFSINSEDYLGRGYDAQGLQGKLDSYLQTQDVDPSMYTKAYLLTAPRFLDYSFNPVSFWYLYNSSNTLSAMILEVNNTFDERRIYFMQASTSIPDTPDIARQLSHRWPKDFHVSPFNSRKGEYTLKAFDPVFPQGSTDITIRNTITLLSSKGHPKLVASLHNTHPGLDPARMTPGQIARFIISWWWVGFATFPRIVKEAGLLFFQKKLHVWYRPEVGPGSLGRTASPSERTIAKIFHVYLTNLIRQNAKDPNAQLRYIPATGHSPVSPVLKHGSTANPSVPILHILSPLFYTRLATSAQSPLDFTLSCLTPGSPSTELVWSQDKPGLESALRRLKTLDRLRRQEPPFIPPALLQRLGWTDNCALDGFVYGQRSGLLPCTVRDYRVARTRLLFAKRAFGGYEEAVQGLKILIEVALSWSLYQTLWNLSEGKAVLMKILPLLGWKLAGYVM